MSYVMLCHDSTVKLTDGEGQYYLAIEATLNTNSGARGGGGALQVGARGVAVLNKANGW